MDRHSDTNAPTHVDEAWAIAQMAARSVSQAETLVERALARAGGGDRFVLLRETIRETGLFRTPAGVLPESPPSVGIPEAIAHETETTVLETGLLRRLRASHAAEALVHLPIPDRLLCFLWTRDIRSGGDVGAVTGLAAPAAAHALDSALTRYTQELDLCAPGTRGVTSRSDDLEALGHSLEPLLKPAGGALKRAASDAPSGSVAVPAGRVPRRSRTRLIAVGVLLVAAVATGVILPRIFARTVPPPSRPAALDLLEAVADSEPATRTAFDTSDPDAGRSWLMDRVEWGFARPTVSGLVLNRVGFPAIASDIRVPAFYFGEPGSERELTLVVLNYALLERERGHLSLDRETLDRLADGQPPRNRTVNGRSAVVLRHRDDLFIAVAGGIDVDLANRITFAP